MGGSENYYVLSSSTKYVLWIGSKGCVHVVRLQLLATDKHERQQPVGFDEWIGRISDRNLIFNFAYHHRISHFYISPLLCCLAGVLFLQTKGS